MTSIIEYIIYFIAVATISFLVCHYFLLKVKNLIATIVSCHRDVIENQRKLDRLEIIVRAIPSPHQWWTNTGITLANDLVLESWKGGGKIMFDNVPVQDYIDKLNLVNEKFNLLADHDIKVPSTIDMPDTYKLIKVEYKHPMVGMEMASNAIIPIFIFDFNGIKKELTLDELQELLT